MKRFVFVSLLAFLIIETASIITPISCAKESEVCIVFFYSPTCHECMEAKDKLDNLKAIYNLNIKKYNEILDEDLLLGYYKAFDVPIKERGAFAVFMGNKHYCKLSQFDGIEEEIKKHVDTGLKCPEPSEDGNAEETVKGFTILTVMAGGVMDGINPCAFATLIFFIAYMEKVKYGRKTLLSVGISFSLAVFTGYLLIGLGILEFYYRIEEVGIISKYIYLFAGLFALILAAFNVWDYFKISNEEKPVLQLPKFLKRRRGRIIKVLTQKREILILSLLAFATGLGISLLEFVCTGQILLPVMAVIKSASSLRMIAFAYLLLYNTMFIVPLLIVMALFYEGYSSEKLGEMQKKRQGTVKLLTALVLGVIGIYMLYILT
ncbi:MAG: hypothetical protein U9O96_04000 [Candidatus Thermoplasmatota archaeon]|nr:hypothetical protein [Candidatus Thermoplasmatota archaeon]